LRSWAFKLLIFSFFELLYELGQRCEFSAVDESELVNEVDKVLETGVEMGLSAEEHNMLEVSMVDVGVDSE